MLWKPMKKYELAVVDINTRKSNENKNPENFKPLKIFVRFGKNKQI